MEMISFGPNTTVKDLKTFVLGGRAVFTLESGKTGKHFTYKIKKKELDGKVFYFANLMTGGADQYTYIGLINTSDFTLRLTAKSKLTNESTAVQALHYFLNHVKREKMAPSLLIYHANTCCCCGRELTDPESIELGIGPKCREKM